MVCAVISMCRLTKYMPILTIRPLIDNKVYLMTTVVYPFFQCPPRFPCQMLFVSFNSSTRCVSCGAGTDNPSRASKFTLDFLWGSSYSIFSFLCNILQIVVRPFAYFFFFWSCYCLSFALQLLIATIWYMYNITGTFKPVFCNLTMEHWNMVV